MRSAILGAGSYGTALAIVLANNGHDIILWGRDKAAMDEITSSRQNARYLPDVTLPNNIVCTDDLAEAVTSAHHCFLAVPSHVVSDLLVAMTDAKLQPKTLINASKGLGKNGEFIFDIVANVFPNVPFAQLSGPSFAKEMARKVPTAVTVASKDIQFAHAIQQHFHYPLFRIYVSDDVIGVSLCGAVKNVLAIAIGVADGLQFGANARAALITRGLAEMRRLGLQLGAKAETFSGLAGIGDLVLTATDDQSRNRRLGLLLGQGKSIEQAQKTIGQSIEGLKNAETVYQLAQKVQCEMPISFVTRALLKGELTAQQAMSSLLSRQARDESE